MTIYFTYQPAGEVNRKTGFGYVYLAPLDIVCHKPRAERGFLFSRVLPYSGKRYFERSRAEPSSCYPFRIPFCERRFHVSGRVHTVEAPG